MSPVGVSFEFFPPKTPQMEATLWASVERLRALAPDFVSVTYGAGGSTRERTHTTVHRILSETPLKPAAHLTCVNATREEVDAVIRAYWQAGVRHIVALRGDPPEGIGAAYTPTPGGYANAAELAAGIKAIADFEISVGCYPEKHPESASFDADLDLLQAKIDAGATRAISQFFFEAETFLRFRDRVAARGISIPIVPGIMPISSFKGLRRMAAGCGATIPGWLGERFEGLDEDAETRKLLAAATAVELAERLKTHGVEQFHIYTLNRADLAFAIAHAIGARGPAQPANSRGYEGSAQ